MLSFFYLFGFQVCRELISTGESTYATSWYHRYSTSLYTEATTANRKTSRTGEVDKDALVSKRDSFLSDGSGQVGSTPDLWAADEDSGGVFHCLQWNLDD